MSTLDIFYIFKWWGVLFVLGLIFFPLTSLIFKNFFDKGYIFSKIIGLLILSYTIWFLSSLKIITFSTSTLILIIFIFLILNIWLLSKNKILPSFHFSKIYLLEEIIFLIPLFFWAFIRAHEPSVHGLEKFMDFGFINSILRADYFPPKDMWLTPFSINYYYFGHLITAVLIKLSFLKPDIGYNIMVASLFATTFAASFSIGANLYHLFTQNLNSIQNHKFQFQKKWLILSGFLSAFLVSLGGNLHAIYLFFENYVPADSPVPFWQLPIKIFNEAYWYPNATRFIHNTIHEFPIYSFVVSDLHGHVINIPAVLLLIAFIIKIFFEKKISRFTLPIFGFLIAVFLMTNVLDGPIYLMVTSLCLLAFFSHSQSPLKALKSTLLSMLVILVTTVIFSLPFWLEFKPFSSGIGVMCAPKFLTDLSKVGPLLFEVDHCSPSPIWMLLILWGFFYFVVLSFIFLVVKKTTKVISETILANYLVLILVTAATILIMIPEIVYVKDIYPAHYRANTVFKFGYQAFIILGLCCGFMIIKILTFGKIYSTITHQTLKKPGQILFTLGFMILFTLVAIYPYFAVKSYYGNLQNYQGLDGLKYLDSLYPSDYKAINWINENIEGQPVILEAQGDSYTDYARVSANTGLPTVVGWPVHEWLWRGSYDEAGTRSADVTTLYETTDQNLRQSLIEKYNIEYIFIGALEKEKYTHPSDDNLTDDIKLEENFANLGRTIFQDGETRIIKLSTAK